MTGSWWWDLLAGVAAGLLLAWVVLIAALVIGRPRGGLLREALRLVPDFLPVVGYADDAIIVAAVLRSVARHAGVQAIHRHWPGTEDGFAALCRITGLTARDASRSPEQHLAQED